MRIAMLSERGNTTPPTPPLRFGGTETAVDLLARGMVQAGHDVTVWAMPGSRSDAYDVRFQGASKMMSMRDLRELEGFDVVHNHNMTNNRTGFLFLERLKRRNPALVQTFHGTFPYYIRPYAAWLNLPPRSKGPRFVCQSRQQVEYARRHGIPNVRFIPNPVEDRGFGDHPLDFFLYLGRLTREKGVLTAIEVAQRAKVPLVIAGVGDPGFVRDEILPHVGPGVTFLGEVTATRRDELYRTAKGLLFPSRAPEGMPLAILEANMSGTPAITSDAFGSARDMIVEGVNGFVCSDVQQMVEATRNVGRLDRGACRRSVADRFSLASVVSMYADLYAELASQGPSGRAGS
jgi:glycosyltransferase involved in cell wall biosynthesis